MKDVDYVTGNYCVPHTHAHVVILLSVIPQVAPAPTVIGFSKGNSSFEAWLCGGKRMVHFGWPLSLVPEPVCLVFGCHGALGDLAGLCDGVVTQRFFVASGMG